MGARNLPFTAGTTVAFGQEYEKAVQSITLNTATILGVEKQLGSIEQGKEATFFISSGDALDMRTNNVEKAFIKGREIDLNNHQKDLFEKYKNR
jgi:imidazolonepropionase-like amidohydrolase